MSTLVGKWNIYTNFMIREHFLSLVWSSIPFCSRYCWGIGMFILVFLSKECDAFYDPLLKKVHIK